MNRVVITGSGIISPLGNNVHSFWNNLKQGKSGISLLDVDEDYGKTVAGVVHDFDPVEIFGKKQARKMDRFTQFALAAAEQALESSELNLDKINKERLGVFVGSGIGGINTLIENVNILNKKGSSRVSPSLVPTMIPNAAAAQISIRLGALGPSIAPVTACSIGNTSIGEAFNTIKHGDADIIFAGGTEAAINSLSLSSFRNAQALTKNLDPASASRPFDVERDGFVISEGAGILVLESLESAIDRSAPILCEVIGYSSSSDAYDRVATDPEGKGAYLSMKKALENGNVTPDDINMISAHATSTKIGDISETIAIKKAIGEKAYNIPITANKSMLGHMLGASGSVEAIALIESIKHGIIPPTINLNNLDPDCDLDYVSEGMRKQQINIGLSNSFGFGGHNATIILKKYS
ncbi:beta-ketoacyl-ACP synthase II [Oceanobacillus neutriphilus]|uniref:3-oxoacyl-[acyl-carrier-protein] synthase 2 n=1 Tax=Oceanobacillus neutriphilus TaxID=531815 RepID=A0ABQ2NSU8_9BACI|nr:beta-ketoacyl-ACP synthase II [Oceanobacillus neutriphilus]GGP08988.1 3-oxoacyl-[acyl-carrier-protein] synthase 2 [Oceanobacillus neutriphilus]